MERQKLNIGMLVEIMPSDCPLLKPFVGLEATINGTETEHGNVRIAVKGNVFFAPASALKVKADPCTPKYGVGTQVFIDGKSGAPAAGFKAVFDRYANRLAKIVTAKFMAGNANGYDNKPGVCYTLDVDGGAHYWHQDMLLEPTLYHHALDKAARDKAAEAKALLPKPAVRPFNTHDYMTDGDKAMSHDRTYLRSDISSKKAQIASLQKDLLVQEAKLKAIGG
jgi:hypothetical protein